MHATTIDSILGRGPLAGSLQHPAAVHDDPAQVLRDDALSTAEKRVILSSWASDANAVEQQPWLRAVPGSGRTVPLSSILAALRRLDDDPPPKGGAALRPGGFGRPADGESFEQVQPVGRRHHGLAHQSKHVRSRALPRLRRDHAARAGRAAAGRAALL
ncbi:MAG: hypothetical protein HZA66_10210 [Rhodopseudomonas palustris]|uniref:Uncharacterized protein n=1 Tax=Rhodopseudomonas palustris TaxID=1076 RepID=A0A933RW83_RHOPL|nr:hypothetical protein [Rhodopseudomonas palustris]